MADAAKLPPNIIVRESVSRWDHIVIRNTDHDFEDSGLCLIPNDQVPALIAALIASEAIIAECAIYLKDGETPRQRMDRDHGDILGLMKLLEMEKRKSKASEAKLAKMREALTSIAANTCCGGCQEAAMVARTALQETGE